MVIVVAVGAVHVLVRLVELRGGLLDLGSSVAGRMSRTVTW